MILVSEIEEFLKNVRRFIDEGKVDFINGKDEKYTLGKLGISIEDAFGMVCELTSENYYQGPTPDHDFPEQKVFEFGIDDVFPDYCKPGSSLYLKLTFRSRKDDLLMMSFHPARELISYPYEKEDNL